MASAVLHMACNRRFLFVSLLKRATFDRSSVYIISRSEVAALNLRSHPFPGDYDTLWAEKTRPVE